MAIDGARLGERAFEHVRALSTEIGPRPAGSHAEAKARDYVVTRLAEYGYRVERMPAPFAPTPVFLPAYSLYGCFLILVGWGFETSPWLGISLPLLFACLPQLTRWLVRRRPRTARTENLVACREPLPAGKPVFILSAHLDSARALAFHSRFWRRISSRTLDIVQRVAVVIAAISLLHLAGFAPPQTLHLVARFLGSLAGGWLLVSEILNQLFHRGRYSPGANDNASGVGVLLALAEHFSGRSFQSIRLDFLFTGAEETGLHGAESFAATVRRCTDEVSVLCLDMVGAGDEVRLVSKEGLLFPLRTDERLNRRVRFADPSARGIDYIHKSGDFAAFLMAGIPSSSLQTSGSMDAELAYHTTDDTLDGIERTALERVAEAVIRLVESVEVGRHPGSSPGSHLTGFDNHNR